MSHQQAEVIYGPLQVRSRLHADDEVVTVHFSVKGLQEQQFTLTHSAARELAIQLMRHSKRIRRASGQASETTVALPMTSTRRDLAIDVAGARPSAAHVSDEGRMA